MSLFDKRAKVVLTPADIARFLHLPVDTQVARVTVQDDSNYIEVHLISEKFEAQPLGVESPLVGWHVNGPLDG